LTSCPSRKHPPSNWQKAGAGRCSRLSPLAEPTWSGLDRIGRGPLQLDTSNERLYHSDLMTHSPKKNRTKKRRADERGAAAVEFALVLPILLLLVFGIVEFGLAFNRWITVTHAAREGVRVYALSGDALEAQTAAEDAAPDIAGEVTCTGTMPDVDQVQMECASTYDLELMIIETPLELTSRARMSRE
jgi:Flp pilus assembly pilin Flp